MKRSPLKRGTSSLSRTSTPARTTRIKPIGKRGKNTREQLDAVRAEVMERAHGRCERCGQRGPLDMHHRLPRSRGGSHEAANLSALCSGPLGCHSLAHAHLIPDWREWIVAGGGA